MKKEKKRDDYENKKYINLTKLNIQWMFIYLFVLNCVGGGTFFLGNMMMMIERNRID